MAQKTIVRTYFKEFVRPYAEIDIPALCRVLALREDGHWLFSDASTKDEAIQRLLVINTTEPPSAHAPTYREGYEESLLADGWVLIEIDAILR